MIEVKKGEVFVSGEEIEILADFGMTAKVLMKHFGRDQILEVCLIGLFAEDRAQMDRIHEQLKESGMDV